MSSTQQLIAYERNLFTHIFQYLNEKDLKRLRLSSLFRNMTYIEAPQHNTLLYGQVQSGKTSKIMEYVKTFRPHIVKVIIIQNNTHMLSQYKTALTRKNITFQTIDKLSSTKEYNNCDVLITISNKFRMKYLQEFMKRNKINSYCLVLDESDQYLRRMKTRELFLKTMHVLHVTATPFVYSKIGCNCKFPIDNVVIIPPPPNYLGINNVTFNEIDLSKVWFLDYYFEFNSDIIRNKFMTETTGLMLMNCYRRVFDMFYCAARYSVAFPTLPFIVLSSNCYVYLNGAKTKLSVKEITKCIDQFNDISHIVIIANRLSLRGINYTNSTYSRAITHQICLAKGDYTNFIQKCRMFGIRSNGELKGNMYCLVEDASNIGYVDKVKAKIATLFKSKEKEERQIVEVVNKKPINTKPIKITISYLKDLCRRHNVRGFSKLKKAELIQLLSSNDLL